MDKILDLANELSDMIASSAAYTTYLDCKSMIGTNAELLTKIQIFKRTQIEYQSKLMQNIQPSFEEEKYVSKLYADLMLIEPANKFLKSENDLMKILRSVYETIGNSCDIDTFI